MSNTINLVLVGLGLIGKRHADIIEKTEDAKLLAIVDPSEDAHNYAIEKKFTNIWVIRRYVFGAISRWNYTCDPDAVA
jgi:predicted dehydrogenase